MLMNALPGVPGEDYPLLSDVPRSAQQFSCRGRVFGGYYADTSTRCQVHHSTVIRSNNSFFRFFMFVGDKEKHSHFSVQMEQFLIKII